VKTKKILPIVLTVLILGGAVVLLLLPAGNIRFDGNEYYSEAELKELIFGEEEPRYFLVRLQEWLGRHTDIPFVESYSLHFGEKRSIRVQIYERSLAGYLSFQNYHLYFDWSGTIVETNSRRIDGIYEITGLEISQAVVGQKLPLSDESHLRSILSITQFLNSESYREGSREVPFSEAAQSIHFQGNNVSVVLKDITVFLGSSDNLEPKLYLMCDILPSLAGRKGTLYLDTYSSAATHPSYTFRER